MKKRNVIGGILILLIMVILGLYFTRNQWAGYLLKKEISNKSHGNLNLSFSGIRIDIFKKRLTVLNPSLTCKNKFLDHDSTLKLTGSKFKELSIYGLFLWDLVIHNEYRCREIVIEHPSFQLAMGEKVKNHVNFNSSRWLKIIKDYKLALIPVKFQVNHVSVKLGKIELRKSKDSGESGGADYSISIEDLGNMDKSTPSGEVFYKNLNVNISNLYWNSKRRNFSLQVDSICYLSSLQEFTITGLHYKIYHGGDNMYTFSARDIRANLPLRKISIDSIAVIPMLKKEAYFEKKRTQTDRVTVYGKSIDFNNFDFSALLNQQIFRAGNISLNNFDVLLERDKNYPLRETVIPMPIDMLRAIPYNFKADSVIIKHGFISYYEYEKKASNPGIFFINNFNVYFLNVTDDFSTLNSAAVLKIHGSGQMMKTSKLNFVLLLPYFSPDNHFRFSAQTSRTDLKRFNILAQNIIGIRIVSGIGNATVHNVTGNDKFATGNVLFRYKNLKLRLYNRKIAKTDKGLGSSFINLVLNRLMVRSNNPRFLEPPRKGIVYFERDPHKSFINYLWKSSLSGIMSTIMFNNKQQRIEKKEEKKESESKE